MNLKFYTSVAKVLKLKVRKFWGLIPQFAEVTGEKPVGGLFVLPPILNRVNKSSSITKYVVFTRKTKQKSKRRNLSLTALIKLFFKATHKNTFITHNVGYIVLKGYSLKNSFITDLTAYVEHSCH